MTPRQPLCKRALTIMRKREMRQKVSRTQIAFSTAHIAKCSSCLADSAVIREMIATKRDRAFDELSARREADAVLARLATDIQGEAKTPTFAQKLTWIVMGMVVASLVAGLALLHFASDLTRDGRYSAVGNTPVSLAPEASPNGEGYRGTSTHAPSTAHPEPLLLTSADSPTESVDTPPSDRPSSSAMPIIKTGAAAQEVLLGDGIRLLARPETELTLTQSDRVAISVALHRGYVVVSVDPSEGGPAVSVQTTAMRVTVTGTVFAVRVEGTAQQVCVLKGAVHVTGSDGAFHTVGRGERLSPGAANPVPAITEQLTTISKDAERLNAIDAARPGYVDWRPETDRVTSTAEVLASEIPSAEIEPAAVRDPLPSSAASAPSTAIRELLLEARRYRLAKQWSSLVETYQYLIDHYPNRPEAASALVALGDVRLRHMKQPKAALVLFNRYIRSGERSILEEAFVGRAEALQVMERTAEERATLLDFVDRFPRSIHTPAARQRLAELEAR